MKWILLLGIALVAPVLAAAETYTCPMHPEVRKAQPGKCPICGMDLVNVDETSGHRHDEVKLRVSEPRLHRAGLGRIKVERKNLTFRLPVAGRAGP